MLVERIEFSEAINDELLFKKPFASLSRPQQVILKSIYGLPLTEKDDLRLWSAFSGAGVYDRLGYLVDISRDIPYTPTEYADITLIIGRRAGKTHGISSFIVAFEALCGGHKSRVGDRQDPKFLQICQDLDTARECLRQFILDWLVKSPVGAESLKFYGKSAITADTIRLKYGQITVGPPTIKLRGQAIPICAMDELCVWPKDREASNPDVEVERAVLPAMMQFHPFDKLIKVSTPLTEEGLLWTAKQHGTDPRARRLVLEAPSAAMENPACKRSFLVEQSIKDPEGFKREYLAQFAKAKDGFLSPDLIDAAGKIGPISRAPEPGHYYIAVMDPAFKHDDFALTIGHMESGDFVQDYLHAWRGTKDMPLRPGAVLDEVAGIMAQYGVRIVTSDQYHDVTLMELALVRGLVVDPTPLTAQLKQQIWTAFNSLLMQRKLHLLGQPDLLDELKKMEKVISRFGNPQFAGSGKRDDLAVVTALAVFKALQMGEPVRMFQAKPMSNQVSEIKRRVQAKVRSGMEEGGNPWWLG